MKVYLAYNLLLELVVIGSLAVFIYRLPKEAKESLRSMNKYSKIGFALGLIPVIIDLIATIYFILS